jgi:hypothetical protein
MTDQTQDGERRRFFRIDDEVCLEYEIISEEEYLNAPQELEQVQQTSFGLSADFATMNFEYSPILNSIRSSNPEIAQYFDFLNRKMDALSQRLLERDIPCEESLRMTVNISASGIAFHSSKKLEDNQPLRIRLVLLPEKIGILVFGRVRHNHDREEDKEMISIDFEHLRYQDQELMIKHNLNKQMLELRQRSEQKD